MFHGLLHIFMAAADHAKDAVLDLTSAFRDHGKFLANAIMRLTGEGPHVDDILQETFMVAYRKQSGFAGRSTLKTWLYGIASNICLHHRRGVARELNALEKGFSSPDESEKGPDSALESAQDRALVHEAMQAIPFKQREVFMLYEIEELDGASIAKLLEIPLSTVWSRLRHARETFTKEIRRRRASELS